MESVFAVILFITDAKIKLSKIDFLFVLIPALSNNSPNLFWSSKLFTCTWNSLMFSQTTDSTLQTTSVVDTCFKCNIFSYKQYHIMATWLFCDHLFTFLPVYITQNCLHALLDGRRDLFLPYCHFRGFTSPIERHTGYIGCLF